jgi:ankyrin repeat protein
MASRKPGSSPSTKAGRLDRAGRSPLHYAFEVSDLNYAKKLIAEGHDVNLADSNGWTPLHFAAQAQRADLAALLLDSGASVDPRDSHGNTPLSMAVFNAQGRGELIELLRKRGADPLAENNHGVSPVRLARTIANYDVAQFFRDLQGA